MCISEQTTNMSRVKSFPNFQLFCHGFCPIVRTKKTIKWKLWKNTYCKILWNFLLFENYGQEVRGPVHCWSPDLKVGGPVSPIPTVVAPMGSLDQRFWPGHWLTASVGWVLSAATSVWLHSAGEVWYLRLPCLFCLRSHLICVFLYSLRS